MEIRLQFESNILNVLRADRMHNNSAEPFVRNYVLEWQRGK